jgi:hypothetical protein
MPSQVKQRPSVQHHALDGLALLPAFVSFAPLLEIEIFELGVGWIVHAGSRAYPAKRVTPFGVEPSILNEKSAPVDVRPPKFS